MRKINKKQKLIIFIAIITFLVIIGIIVGANVIKTNIANGNYNSANSNSSSGNLLPEYIKEGITLGGVTGSLVDLDTSDATATEEDIVWKKTAYVNGVKITGTKVITVAQGKESQKVFEENTFLLDDYGNRVKVPAGFKISKDSATAVTGGVVIEDVNAGDNNTKGSQFVWVPIGDIKVNADKNTTTITLGIYTFLTDGIPSQYTGDYTEDTDDSHISSQNNAIAKDINDFIKKTNSSGGYYIGRYEAGDSYATSSERTSNSTSTNPIVCKAGVYPYTYITQPQASSLCQGMYNNSNFESDLVNSYAWDTAIIFIQKFSGDTNYSRQIGKNVQNSLQKVGESTLSNVDTNDEKQDVRCNIYDMAGNAYEWCTTTCPYSTTPCVYRGGSYDNSEYQTFYRNHWYTSYNDIRHPAARSIIYL